MGGNKIIFNLFSDLKGRFTDKEFGKALRYFKEVNKLGETEKRAYVQKRLNAFLEFADKEIPFYKGRLANAQGEHLIESFDALTKKDINAHELDLLHPSRSVDELSMRRSGGTTGVPTRVYVDRFVQSLEGISYFDGLQLMGWSPGMPIIRLFGGSLGTKSHTSWRHKIRNIILDESFLPAFELRQDNVAEYAQSIKAKKSCIIMGYASALNNLAQYAENAGIKFTNVKQVFTTAEMLNRAWYENIRRVFQCPVKSYYGCGEVESFSYQIEEQGPYKISYGIHWVESNDQNEILLTTYNNRSFPLIRYRNGDKGKVVWENDGAYITEFAGRISDQLYTVDGELVSGSMAPHMIYKLQLPTEKYQLVQTSKDKIEFRYNKSDGTELTQEQMDKCATTIQGVLGDGMQISFMANAPYQVSKSGKYRITINKVLEK